MADKIINYMGADQWKARGGMESAPSREDTTSSTPYFLDAKGAAGAKAFQNAFAGKSGQVDMNAAHTRSGMYDANDSDMGYERMSYMSHKFVGRPNQTAGNKFYEHGMPDHEAGLSQHGLILDILGRPGQERIDLVKRMAIDHNSMVREARRVGHKDDNIQLVAPTQSAARSLAALMTAVAKQFPADTREYQKNQLVHSPEIYDPKLRQRRDRTAEELMDLNKDAGTNTKGKMIAPQKDGDIDWKTLNADYVAIADMKHSREHKRTSPSGEVTVLKGSFAVIAGKGQEKVAAAAVTNVPAGSIVMPSANVFKEINLRACKARVEKGFRDGAQAKGGNAQIIGKSDMVIVYLDDDKKGRAWQDAGQAAKRGKLARAIDSKGRVIPLAEARKAAIENHVSDAERRRADQLKSPAKTTLLALLNDEKDGSLSRKDMTALVDNNKTAGDLHTLTTSEEGILKLAGMGVSQKGIRLLGNGDAMEAAAAKYDNYVLQAKLANVQLLEMQDFPKSWKNPPAFVFAKGDVSLLNEVDPKVGILGDGIPAKEENETARRMIASSAAPIIKGLANENVTRVMVEGQLPVENEGTGGDVIFITSGHEINSTQEIRKEREANLRAGALLLSTQPPSGEYVYDSKFKAEKLVPATTTDASIEAAGRAMGGLSDELVITNIERDDTRSPARAAIRTFAEDGEKRPIVLDFTEAKAMPQMVAGNALITGRGEKAFNNAGFGEAVSKKLGDNFAGDLAAISTGRNVSAVARIISLKANDDPAFKPVITQKAPSKEKLVEQMY